jgi:6-phosphogluconolactonase
MKNKLPFLLLMPLFWAACSPPKQTISTQSEPLMFVGTYTQKLGHVEGKAFGVYTCRLNPQTGAVRIVDSAQLVNPSFLTVSPDKKLLFSTAETGGTPSVRTGSVAAFKITEGGKLLKINEVSSYGAAPCHVSTTQDGKFVMMANYSTGNIVTYGIRPDGGLTDSLCYVKHEGKSPWAHQIRQHPNGRHIFAVDKGSDKIIVYSINEKGILTPLSKKATMAGAGPRHLDFCPTNPNLIAVINENSSTLTTYRFDEKTATLMALDSLSTLPSGFSENNTCADVHFHPSGKFIYGSNRGHNSLVIYAFDAQTGKIRLVGHESVQGKVPRNFMVLPNGKMLLVANQNSSNVVAFSINAQTGLLTPTGQSSYVPTPVCLQLW